jgi:hypothetical protein
MRHVLQRFAHQEARERQPDHSVSNAEIERLRAQAVFGSDPPGGQRAARNSDVAGELIQTHRKPALLRSDEVGLQQAALDRLVSYADGDARRL